MADDVETLSPDTRKTPPVALDDESKEIAAGLAILAGDDESDDSSGSGHSASTAPTLGELGQFGLGTGPNAAPDAFANALNAGMGLGSFRIPGLPSDSTPSGSSGKPYSIPLKAYQAFMNGGKDFQFNGGDLSGDASSLGLSGFLQQARACGLVNGEQCVALATACVGIRLGDGHAGSNVHEWRPGDSVMDGNLKIGTPIATFLNRDGSQSNLYAGGGCGTPGAGLDHAAVFDGYVRSRGGAIMGIKVKEQYTGSGGTQEHTYLFHDPRGGEHSAENYFAIKLANGQYLGGDRNPMNAAHAPEAVHIDAPAAVKPIVETPKATLAPKASLSPIPTSP